MTPVVALVRQVARPRSYRLELTAVWAAFGALAYTFLTSYA